MNYPVFIFLLVVVGGEGCYFLNFGDLNVYLDQCLVN